MIVQPQPPTSLNAYRHIVFSITYKSNNTFMQSNVLLHQQQTIRLCLVCHRRSVLLIRESSCGIHAQFVFHTCVEEQTGHTVCVFCIPQM